MDVAAAGLTAVGAIQQASMQSAGAEHAAQQAEFQAQTAEINANQTDAYYRDSLRKTLSSIDAARASAGMITSPTVEAYKDEQARLAERQRSSQVLSDQAQAAQSRQDAQFYDAMASGYTTAGYIKAASGFMGSMSKSPGSADFLMGGF